MEVVSGDGESSHDRNEVYKCINRPTCRYVGVAKWVVNWKFENSITLKIYDHVSRKLTGLREYTLRVWLLVFGGREDGHRTI